MALGGGGGNPERRRAWRGAIEYTVEEADSLLALLIALAFTVLGVLGNVSQQAINSSILGTLAVIALMMLRDRLKTRALSQKTKDELRRIVDDGATVRILRGTEVQSAHAEGREKTDYWYFKGGTGTYLRALTLPRCLEDRRRRMEFRIEIIDPRDLEACRRYDNFRLSRTQATRTPGDSWAEGQARLESYATIVAACWYKQNRDYATIRVGLTRIASTFRYDMSSKHLIITRDDPELPAELIPHQASLFAAYGRELETSFGQAERVDVEGAGQRVKLSQTPGPSEVQNLLAELGLDPERSLSRDDATRIAVKALNAKNPYPAQREP